MELTEEDCDLILDLTGDWQYDAGKWDYTESDHEKINELSDKIFTIRERLRDISFCKDLTK